MLCLKTGSDQIVLNGLHGFANGVDPIRNIEDNREVCNALDEAWERWIREQDWESVIENHLCPYVEELLLVGDENGETPAQVLVNIALECGPYTVNLKTLETVLKLHYTI